MSPKTKLLFLTCLLCTSLYGQQDKWLNFAGTGQINFAIPGDNEIRMVGRSKDFTIHADPNNSQHRLLGYTKEPIDFFTSGTADDEGNWWLTGVNGIYRLYPGGYDSIPLPIQNNFANQIISIGDGKFWLNFGSSIALYDKGGWTFWDASNSALPPGFVSRISLHPNGSLYLLQAPDLYKLENGNITSLPTPNGGLTGIYSSIFDMDGNFWLLNYNIIYKYDGTQYQSWNIDNEAAISCWYFNDLTADPEGGVWFPKTGIRNSNCETVGLIRFKNGVFEEVNTDSEGNTIPKIRLLEGGGDKLMWAFAENGTIYVFKNQAWEKIDYYPLNLDPFLGGQVFAKGDDFYLTSKNGIGSLKNLKDVDSREFNFGSVGIRSFMTTEEKLISISYNPNSANFTTVFSSELGEDSVLFHYPAYIQGFWPESEDLIYFIGQDNFSNNLLSKWNGHSVETVSLAPDSTIFSPIRELHKVSDHEMWFSTGQHLFIFDGTRSRQVSPGFPTFYGQILTGPDGNVWVSSSIFVGSYDGAEWTLYFHGFGNTRIDFDSKGVLWMAGSNGILHHLENGRFVEHKPPQGMLALANFFAISEGDYMAMSSPWGLTIFHEDGIYGYGFGQKPAPDDSVGVRAWKAFPNPVTQGRIQIESLAVEGFQSEVNVYDLQGRRLLRQTLFHPDQQIRQELDLSSLPNGLYILHLRNGDIHLHKRIQINHN